jgi:2',3'-cyclic-nucleotide 2'-phosphodiesterase (5'-nucleotidase family)
MNKYLLILLSTMLVSCVTVYETTSYSATNHIIDQATDSINDPSFNKILKPYEEQMGNKLNEIIAWSDTALTSYRPESPLSNLLSDILLNYGIEFSEKNQLNKHPDFSLMNHGGIRSFIPPGNVTVKNMYELIPFENELVYLKLSGSQVESLAHHLASRGGEGVSGISFGISNNKAINIKVNGKSINRESMYWLVTNDYLANGGDGMEILIHAEERFNSGQKLRDIYIKELREMKNRGESITGKTDGRVHYVE